MTLHVIEKAKPQADFTVELVFGDGRAGVVDFRPVIAQGGVFRALDDPARFASMKIGQRGRTLVWIDADGDEIDFCADALWERCDTRANAKRAAIRSMPSSAQRRKEPQTGKARRRAKRTA